jgi:hypothetical protein
MTSPKLVLSGALVGVLAIAGCKSGAERAQQAPSPTPALAPTAPTSSGELPPPPGLSRGNK